MTLNPGDILDLSAEQTPCPTGPIAQGRDWRARDTQVADQVIRLDQQLIDELCVLAEALRGRGDRIDDLDCVAFDLPAWRETMTALQRKLDQGPGFAIVDRFPLEQPDHEAAAAAFWVLGQFLARPVAQKWDGTLLYHVRNTGQAFGYGVRGSYTDVELAFHCDNAFGIAPPDYVGLLCLNPAKSGGLSRFCSLYAVHDRLLQTHRDLLARLYRPFLLDRQAEHAPEAPKLVSVPLFRTVRGALQARVNVSLVRKGYELAGEPLDDETESALQVLEQALDDPEFWVEAPLEQGQLQYLNNREVAHYRSHFTDHDDPAMMRHLVRTWHRATGGTGYDG